MADELFESLDRIPLFEGLTAPVLRRIAAQMKVRQYHRGEVIVWQGKPSDSLFVLREGIAAVNRSLLGARAQTIAYVMPGSTFGEVGILEQQPRSASVVALTDVEVLVLRREAFMAIMQEHASVAIALARGLGRALVEANRRQLDGTRTTRVVLVVDATAHGGCTLIGHALASMLAKTTAKSTVYTEHPDVGRLLDDLGLVSDVDVHVHPAGYEVLVSRPASSDDGPEGTRLLLDRMLGHHDNVVIGLSGDGWDDAVPLLEHANQVIIVTAPADGAPAAVERLYQHVRLHTRPDRTGIFVVANRTSATATEAALVGAHDFALPFMGELPALAELGADDDTRLGPLLELARALVDRLDRTHQISVYIPTTVDTDQRADTSEFVQQTLAFLGRCFGGATSIPARGVWNSAQVGLVGEDVYIVRTYATATDMNEHLDRVVEHTKWLKQALRQEAMALEVDRKLVLI